MLTIYFSQERFVWPTNEQVIVYQGKTAFETVFFFHTKDFSHVKGSNKGWLMHLYEIIHR